MPGPAMGPGGPADAPRPVRAGASGLLMLLGVAGAGFEATAAEADSDGPLFGRETITGTWSGHRTALAERGVEVGLAVYSDAFAVLDGGLETDLFFPGLVEPSLGLDLGQLFGWNGTYVFIRGLGMYGRDPGEGTGSLNAPSNLAHTVQTFRLFEAWIERSFLDESFSARFGLHGLDAEFDVKETAGVFMNGGFGTGVDLSQSGRNGPCIYPTSCLGLRLRYQPTPNHYVQAAIMEGTAGDPDDPHGTRVSLDYDDEGLFTIAEMGFVRGADEGRFLRAALGVWHYSAAFDDLREVNASGDPRQRHMKPGFYALLEGELYREPARPTEGLSGFVRIGTADPDVHQVRQYASAGLAGTGMFPGRGDDVTAIGVSVPVNGSTYKAARRQAGSPVDDAELAIELTHYVPLLPWFSVQFDAQYIINPGTDPAVADALLVGLRCQFTF